MPRKKGLMGKSLAVICLATMSLGFLPSAHADGLPQVILTTSTDTTAVGGELKVRIKGLQLEDVYANEINLVYDSTKLRFNSAVSDLSGGFTVSPVLNGNMLQLAHTSVGDKPGVSGDKELFTLSFTGIASGTADIGLDTITLVDSQLNAVNATGGGHKSVSVVNSGSGSGSGNPGGSGGTNPAPPPLPSPAPIKITDDGKGKKTVELPPAASEVKVAVSQLGVDLGSRLEFKKDKFSVEIPPEVLTQLVGSLSGEERNRSAISFAMSPLSSSDANTLIDRVQKLHNVGLKPSGDVYDFNLQLITGENQTVSLTSFTKPLTLRIKVDPSLNAKLVSIYHIADNGVLNFIGGTYANGEISADIHQPGRYAALEYSKTFADVPAHHWAKDVITELAAKHIVTGTSHSDFEPERQVTRAEFTALLVRALQLTDKASVSFSDVSVSDWFHPEISIAVQAGIINGKSETSFAPEASITREEMVTMLVRAYQILHPAAELPSADAFDDEDAVSPWAAANVKNARALRLIEGREANLFVPQGLGTRAEASQLIYNIRIHKF
ncbi:S-layer homology domain-containing protein [Paenibacillus silviterrae]|uniref:S-layer homology domain-containing protein n=1 Tax=Paenibacillus silviterrae TaxID=3242194 RepID=UPI0025427238|nr:S-layer homology domain-containing protein [Paenibacillus chinjuensis]